ncbi:MAG TPA: STAS domain-containing protein [Tepidisphaeraceae bacterium]|jgi:anti-anti-sigma factor|nr:STAS domain-containing protein [Tepidisphaeraceae bacterium]
MKIEEFNNVCLLTAAGDLAGREAEQIGSAVEERIRSHRFVHFVMDLTGVDFVDSAGLEMLLASRHRCEERSGQLKLVGLTDNCRQILRLTRLEHKFESHTDLNAALRTMG